MRRVSAANVRLNPNLRALAVYPQKGTAKTMTTLQTVGIRLSREQAVDLAKLLLALSQDHEQVDITAGRDSKRKSDGTFKVTVTSAE